MIFVMAQNKSLVDRLRVYGVLRIAEEVAHAHGLKVAQLSSEGSARSELVQRLVDAGWSSANVARVLDAPGASIASGVAAPAAKKNLADGGTHRVGRLSSGRADSASEDGERASRRSDGPPDAPAARTSSSRATARAISAPASPPVAVSAAGDGGLPRAEAPQPRERLVRLPLAGTVNVLPLHERPRMFPGRGVRYDDCINTSDCLGRAVAAEPNVKAVHCPPYCKFRETADFEQRLAEVSTSTKGRFEC